jgi:hypothetical protein
MKRTRRITLFNSMEYNFQPLKSELMQIYRGGGNGSANSPCTEEEYQAFIDAGTWEGGYVVGFGAITITRLHIIMEKEV